MKPRGRANALRRGLLASVLAPAWGPVPAAAQAGTAALRDRPWRIGFLFSGPAPVVPQWSLRELVIDELRRRGHEIGTGVLAEALYAHGELDRLPALAEQLLQWGADVLVAAHTPAVQAARRASATVPIVMLGAGDPVASGLVASLARPGGNITGIAALGPELAGKTVELLRDLRPDLRRIGALLHDQDPFTPALRRGLAAAARSLRLELLVAPAGGAPQLAGAVEQLVRQGAEALFVQPTLPLRAVAELALQNRLPAGSFVRSFAEAGGLLAYAPGLRQIARRGAAFLDRLRQGARPAELPVEQVTEFDLLLNQRSARTLRLDLPATLLARATEVLQ